MNQQLSPDKIAELKTQFPAVKDPPLQTRRERLDHWASLVEKHQGTVLLYSNLEYQPPSTLDDPRWVTGEIFFERYPTALHLAVEDPTLQKAGLVTRTIRGVMDFFQLTIPQLHAFSCDCGGVIANHIQAERIRNIA